MKKAAMLLCAGVLACSLTACGSKDTNQGAQGEGQTMESMQGESAAESQAESSQTPSSESSEASVDDNAVQPGENGWSEGMEKVRAAVVKELGDKYWPSMQMTPDILEMNYGITEDMYVDYLAEGPMISAHVDTLIVIEAKEDTAAAVEEAFNTYRDGLVNDSLQYPSNIGKIQASRIERLGNFVCFVQLGGDTTEALDSGDEAVIAQCQEVNELVIEIISQNVQH